MSSTTNHTRNPVYLNTVYLPLFLLVASLKIARGLTLGSVDSVGSALAYLLVDFSLFVVLASVFYTLLCLAYRPMLKSVGLLVLYCLTCSLVLIEVVSHELFIQSGLILNSSLLQFGLERSEMLFKVIEHQLSTTSTFILIVTILYLILTPVWLIRKLGSSRIKGNRLFSFIVTIVFVLGSSLLLVYSSAFGIPREEFRSASSHLVISYFESDVAINEQPSPTAFKPAVELQAAVDGIINNKLNIAVIILESTREKSVAPYVDTEVTPYFAELAAQSLLMKHAYSTSPHTSRAVFSILCGRFPRSGKLIAETLENGILQPCLPHLLEQQGYTTAFFQSATEDFENRAQLTKNMGFSTFVPLEKLDTNGFEKSNYFGYEDNVMLPASQEWLANQDQPFLATYLTVTPHFHYDIINRYGWKNYVADIKYNAYLNTLHYQDNFLKNLIQQYKDLGKYENTVFVILGDHGEAFREHRLWGHGNILYEEGVKVPFIIHYGKKLTGTVLPRVGLMDVVPSILGQLDFVGSDDLFPGRDLQQTLNKRDIFLECISPRQCSALIDAKTGLKLIHNYQRKPDQLFDLTADPGEITDLSDEPQFQQVKGQLLGRLQQLVSEITVAGPIRKYDSWAYHPKPVIWMTEPPVTQVSLQNNITTNTVSGDGTAGIVQVSTSKNHIYAADSFDLSLLMKASERDICVQSDYKGIKRHQHRSKTVASADATGYAYFQTTENLQVVPDASRIDVDVYLKSNCSESASVLSHHQIVIELLHKEVGEAVFSSKRKQLYSRQALPMNIDTLPSSKYLYQLMDHDFPATKLNLKTLPKLRSAEFVANFRNRMIELQNSYGNYQTILLESVWQSYADSQSLIYRYKVVFSENKLMDFRVHIENSEIIGFYYYHPWKPDRPM